jgi:uncharacterized protein YdiU (UPF0061 family)
LREYLVSEAMHALGIPTSRALAAVSTGEPVLRETVLPGAVLARVASSHIRVGTFQYFAARGDEDAVARLCAHVITRHYPEATDALGLLDAVIARQAALIADWMSVGFIHGVMNTDNAQVAGETIDYGPCAFMDTFRFGQVFSSIDQFGRYAYINQPNIAVWNMAQFATCLLPLIDANADVAVEKATAAVHAFPALYTAAWLKRFRAKLGLRTEEDGDEALVDGLLQAMEQGGADFTNVFAGLTDGTARDWFTDPGPWDAWAPRYAARTSRQGGPDTAAMARSNPVIIPRNHRVEAAIAAALEGDFSLFHSLCDALSTPYRTPEDPGLRQPPEAHEAVTQTFCGT